MLTEKVAACYASMLCYACMHACMHVMLDLPSVSQNVGHLSMAAIMCSCEGGEKVEREEEREEESELLLRVLATLLISFGSVEFTFVASIVSSLSSYSAF